MHGDPSGEAFELRVLFLRELEEGHSRARIAFSAVRANAGDAAALSALRDFFHKVAGTAGSVGSPVLGRLASACESAMQLQGSPAPPLLLRIVEDGLEGAEEALRAERVHFEEQPISQPPLAGDLPPRREGSPPRILIVDDDRFSARLVGNVLRSAGFDTRSCTDPQKALDLIAADPPDLIILDVAMPGMDGFDVCRNVRSSPALQLLPIVFLTARGNVEQRVRGFAVGANDYLAKPFEPKELVARVRSHLQRLGELREMAVRDGLTRCYNNKYFKDRLEQELVRSRRYNGYLSLGMVDLDHFKRINDTFGHPAGDAVLSHLASLITASLRSNDVVARYGGEEFGFLLIEAQVAEAAVITNRLRERIARHEFILPSLSGGDLTVQATVSIGLAHFRPEDTVASLIGRADAALYKAKASGRNQVRLAT
jgi:diguanylate cyclase (GGDEF)-like protein